MVYSTSTRYRVNEVLVLSEDISAPTVIENLESRARPTDIFSLLFHHHFHMSPIPFFSHQYIVDLVEVKHNLEMSKFLALTIVAVFNYFLFCL